MEQCRAMVSGRTKKDKNMLETGKVIRPMVMVFIVLKRVIIKVRYSLIKDNLPIL